MSFKALVNGKDTIVGADVELAKAIAEELGVKLELSSMSFDNVLSSLQTGKADMAISGLSATKERKNAYDSQIHTMKLRMLFLLNQVTLINSLQLTV